MTVVAQEVPAEWRGILRQDERILWQGAPQAAFYRREHYKWSLVGALVVVFVLVFVLETEIWAFQLMMLVCFVVGAGPPIKDAFLRRFSFYSLSNQRAFIGVDAPLMPRNLKTYPIRASTEVHMSFQGQFSAVYFAYELHPGRDGGQWRLDIGFDSLSNMDAEKV